jgi:hypothetical protein
VFSDEEERYLAFFIRREFIEKHRFMSPGLVNILAWRFKICIDVGIPIDDNWAFDIMHQVRTELSDTENGSVSVVENSEIIDDDESDIDEYDDDESEDDLDDPEDDRDDDDDSDEDASSDWERIPFEKFKATTTWRNGFLRRNGFSIRKPHVKRRPARCEEALAQ